MSNIDDEKARAPRGIKFPEFKSGPPALDWEPYAARISEEYATLVAKKAPEPAFQSFFEEHVSFLPGAFGFGVHSGHWPFPDAVISQPVLPGLSTKKPDFMWIATNSGVVFPVLIEIETPGKRWFNKDGTQTADLSQAQNQLAEWRDWFTRPGNESVFFEEYKLPPHWRGLKTFEPKFVLIYGTSAEFADRPDLNRKRTKLERADEHYASFDRLTPSAGSRDLFCITRRSKGYEAVAVPPTYRLGPYRLYFDVGVAGREDAIRRSASLSEERKDFLIERLPYWDAWFRGRMRVSSGGWE